MLSQRGPTCSFGSLDRAAMSEARAILPRGQCAPLLASTGALLQVARQHPGARLRVVCATSCGPCRYALFGPAWQRALRPYTDVELLTLPQSWAGLTELFGAELCQRLLESMLVADALTLVERRLRPHVHDRDALDATWSDVVAAVAADVGQGAGPIAALAGQRAAFQRLRLRPREALGRIVLIGEPWSLHVAGDAQAHVARLLGDAGIEVEAPPLALWLAYRLWEQSRPAWGVGPAATVDLCATREHLRWLTSGFAQACRALDLTSELPCVEALAELARPYLPACSRGGYGHVEVGLAARARAERRAHAVISVKSFGCIPSSGISDAIVPAVLGDALGFLALEVSEDGVATRESRLMLQVGMAHERARAELALAQARAGAAALASWSSRPPSDPVSSVFELGSRPFACSLACELAAQDHTQEALCP